MVMLPTYRLLIVSLIFFCVISSTASARSLRETTSSRHVEVAEKAQSPNSEFNDHKVQSKGGEQLNGDDLVTMDYTPAKKNPPIHN